VKLVSKMMLKRTVLVGCMLGLIVGCASGPKTTVKKAELADNAPKAPYANVLVVGIASNPGDGRRFANELAAKITNSKTVALPSHRENSGGKLTEESVRNVIQSMEADAVLVSSVKKLEFSTKVDAERTEVAQARKSGNLFNFFRYDYTEVKSPELVKLTYDVTLTTDVYDSTTGEKVYTLETITVNGDTAFEIILSESTMIAKQLRRDGLVY
jgi:hypothetical protein